MYCKCPYGGGWEWLFSDPTFDQKFLLESIKCVSCSESHGERMADSPLREPDLSGSSPGKAREGIPESFGVGKVRGEHCCVEISLNSLNECREVSDCGSLAPEHCAIVLLILTLRERIVVINELGKD